MLIAREKRKTNIAEYILYLWQVEDLIRACKFDMGTIENQIISQFQVEGTIRKELIDWYSNLTRMMEKEQIQEKGHLQFLVNLVNDLNEFHIKLFESRKDPLYLALVQTNEPNLAVLRKKSGNENLNDVEISLNALYGLALLKMQKKEINPDTLLAVKGLGSLMGHLSARYLQFEKDDFEF